MDRTVPQPPRSNPSREELLEQLHSLRQRVNGVAHDLNNMLGAMIGYNALALDDLPVANPNHAFLTKAMEAGAEAQRLIAELVETVHQESPRRGAGSSRAA